MQNIARLLLIVGAKLAGLLRRGEVEKFILATRQAAENRRGQRNRRDAVGDAIEIDLDGLDRFFFFLFLLFVLLFFVPGFFFFLIVFFVCVLFLLFVCGFFFVALRFERRFLVAFNVTAKIPSVE